MDDMADIKTVRTNLEMTRDLRERIMVQAKGDLRSFKPEILALLDEACRARERKIAPRQPQHSDN